MDSYVLGLEAIDKAKLPEVGSKAFNLGRLSRLKGIRVPKGVCVITRAYQRTVGTSEELAELLDRLSHLKLDERDESAEITADIRTVIRGLGIPSDIEREVVHHLTKLGAENAYAVRSSATSEDLPMASFAGQQDTYLNVKGQGSILQHVRKCWASLFSERAVAYRIQNGLDHRDAHMAVVIQRMVFPQAAGVLFTADPVTSNRKVLAIDAGFGLGEALVSGLVNPDTYRVREGRIVETKISTKRLAAYPLEEGGTGIRETERERQARPALSNAQILQLEGVGRRIEAHFGCPQDVEWCLTSESKSPAAGKGRPRGRSGEFYILQSRPITTLFPVPASDGLTRVYASVGHQQMMTDAIRPLGLSIFGLLYEGRPAYRAAGRLFLDLTPNLASPVNRKVLLTATSSDPLLTNALVTLTRRKRFMASLQREQGESGKSVINIGPGARSRVTRVEPAIIQELIARSEASIGELRRRFANLSGDELFASILQDQDELRAILFDPRSFAAINAGMSALRWLNRNMEKWLGEKSVADTLSQSVADNVTSEMGLALLDVADVVRPYPAVIEYFRHANADTFFDDLANLVGGDAVSRALRAYLAKYGMRCSGEIDITRTRWSEQPTALIPILLSNINNCEPNAHAVKSDQGRLKAAQMELDLLRRLEQLPGGERKAKQTKKMIGVLRTFVGYREYPKYAFIQRYWIYKQALLNQAAELVQRGVIREKEDVYYLSLEEFRDLVRTNKLDYSIVTRRRTEYEADQKLMPPRVMTSEGEVISGRSFTGDAPEDALAGIPASAGIVEGRARVLLKMEGAAIEAGDILVTTYTDPSWTPLFVSARGLVTEVGGPMTHGAVIAREYGLPAVVSVDNATKLIKDGQVIRVNGAGGYVEILRAGE